MTKTNCTLIRAAAYVRKSTGKETDSDGYGKQEKSIPMQKEELRKLRPEQHAAVYDIVRTYADPGVPGWKRGSARPDFARMLADAAKYRDVDVILVDDLDRFSRATVNLVFADLTALEAAGVKGVHSASQGYIKIDMTEPGSVYRFVSGAMAGNESSRKTGRRVASARRVLAREGKTGGGRPPYGMAPVMGKNDKGQEVRQSLEPGDLTKVKVVKRIFAEFVGRAASMNSIVNGLNRDGVKAPRGGVWYVAGVKEILMQAAYKGALSYGRQNRGVFYTTDADGEVVDARDFKPRVRNAANRGVIVKEGVYPAIVKPTIWEAAQQRLAGFPMKGSRRPREDGYPLSGGVLRCDHCGRTMYGCKRKGGRRVYRCGTNARVGSASCGNYEIWEERILPFVLKTLAEEIDDLTRIEGKVPEEIMRPADDAERLAAEAEAAALKVKIDNAREAVMYADARDRPFMDAKLKVLWAKLDALKAELTPPPQAPEAELDALADLQEWTRAFSAGAFEAFAHGPAKAYTEWSESFRAKAIRVPFADGKRPAVARFDTDAYEAAWDGKAPPPPGVWCDHRAVNEALHVLGAEIRLRWERREETINGKVYVRNVLVRGRFRLGQKNAEISGHILHSTATRT